MNRQRLLGATALAVLAGIGGFLTAPVAIAESTAKDESVMSRPRPDYDPLGIPIGGDASDPGSPFILLPRLDTQFGWESNVFREESNPQDDFFVHSEASLNLRSDWELHSFGITARGALKRYFKKTKNDWEEAEILATGTLSISEEFSVSARAGSGFFHEERDDPDSPTADNNVNEFWRHTGFLSASFTPGDLVFRAEGGAEVLNFLDNGGINNDDRDFTNYVARTRVGYTLLPGITAFVEPEYNWRIYDVGTDDNGFERNSEGWSVIGGVTYDLTGVAFLELGGGYFEQSYDDPVFPESSGWTSTATLTWNPTEVMTVTGNVRRGVQETTLAGVSGVVATSTSLGIDYEITEQLLLNSVADFGWQDFKNSSREDEIFRGRAGLIYLVNEYIETGVSYEYAQRWSNAPTEDFKMHRLLLTLSLQL
ncbi:MAG: outer membrane beta-barrel protein [Rhodovibrionaceae bacterium]